jgi:hypothetical protein
MATWQEFADARPEMARAGRALLDDIPIAYLATTRRDGSPRVHPVCPIFADGRMFVAVPEWSPKRFDLANDGRYALHALPGKWRGEPPDAEGDDEFYVTGRARRVSDDDARRLVSEAAGHAIQAGDWLFELDLEYVMTAVFKKVGQPDTYPVRQEWRG